MSAIKYKTIPVYYSKSNILYFDTLESFNSKGFEYLQKTRPCNPMSQFATHKINMNEALGKISGMEPREIRPIDKLILSIGKRLKSRNLSFGMPIGFENDSISELDESSLQEFDWKPKRSNLIRSVLNVATSSTFEGLVNVGHGLSFIDVPNSFMYDAGGSVGYKKFISKIPTIKYNIVISHMHFDHYKFLKKLNMDGYVNEVILPQKIYAGERIQKMLDDISATGTVSCITGKLVIGRYTVFTPNNRLVKKYDLNTTSLLARGNGWLLTGDSTWEIITNEMGGNISEKNIIVPHHGSPTSGMPLPKYFDGDKEFWVSYRHNVHKLPNAKVDFEYDKLGTLNKVKA